MGAFCRLLGRLLFVSLFVFIAFQLKESEQLRNKDIQTFTNQYPKFYNWVMKDLGVQQAIGQHIPKGFIEPAVVTPLAPKITEYKIYFLFGASALVFLGIRGGGFLLSLFQWFQVLVVFNPLLAEGQFNYVRDSYAVLQQLALLGGCYMMCCGFGGSCSAPVKEKKQKKSTPQPSKKASAAKKSK